MENRVRWRGKYTRACPYCGREGARIAYGMECRSLSPLALIALIDRGWTRSGTWVYYPYNTPSSCCPQYQIRAPTSAWVPSKNLRRTFARFRSHFRSALSSPSSPSPGADAGASPSPSGWEGYTVSLVPAAYSSEAFALFREYQVAVHNEDPDDVTPNGYRAFLIDSPVSSSSAFDSGLVFPANDPMDLPFPSVHQRKPDHPANDDGNNDHHPISSSTSTSSTTASSSTSTLSLTSPQEIVDRYGLYHMEHRYNGELLMVSVIELLPESMVSVYCFYNPVLRHTTSPGLMSALYEMRWANARSAEFKRYYLGLFIPGNPKMGYKTRFRPAELLCPITTLWVPAEDVMCTTLASPTSSFGCFALDTGLLSAEDGVLGALAFGADLNNLAQMSPRAFVFAKLCYILGLALLPPPPSLLQLPMYDTPDPGAIVYYAGTIVDWAFIDVSSISISASTIQSLADYCSLVGPILSRVLIYTLAQ